MTKAELAVLLAAKNDISKTAAEQFVTALLDVIQEVLIDEGKVSLANFGMFAAEERAARKGRNPRTGEEIEIAASKVVKFRPGKTLKDTVR